MQHVNITASISTRSREKPRVDVCKTTVLCTKYYNIFFAPEPFVVQMCESEVWKKW